MGCGRSWEEVIGNWFIMVHRGGVHGRSWKSSWLISVDFVDDARSVDIKRRTSSRYPASFVQ